MKNRMCTVLYGAFLSLMLSGQTYGLDYWCVRDFEGEKEQAEERVSRLVSSGQKDPFPLQGLMEGLGIADEVAHYIEDLYRKVSNNLDEKTVKVERSAPTTLPVKAKFFQNGKSSLANLRNKKTSSNKAERGKMTKMIGDPEASWKCVQDGIRNIECGLQKGFVDISFLREQVESCWIPLAGGILLKCRTEKNKEEHQRFSNLLNELKQIREALPKKEQSVLLLDHQKFARAYKNILDLFNDKAAHESVVQIPVDVNRKVHCLLKETNEFPQQNIFTAEGRLNLLQSQIKACNVELEKPDSDIQAIFIQFGALYTLVESAQIAFNKFSKQKKDPVCQEIFKLYQAIEKVQSKVRGLFLKSPEQVKSVDDYKEAWKDVMKIIDSQSTNKSLPTEAKCA